MHKGRCEEVAGLVRDLWPQWTPADRETQVWIEILYPYDYEPAKAAIKAVYAEQTRFTIRPPLGKIREKIRAFLPARKGPLPEPVLHYTLECIEHDRPIVVGRKYKFYIGRPDQLPDEDVGKRWAENKRQCFERDYKGHWITIWASEKGRQ